MKLRTYPTYDQIVTSGRAALGVRRYHTWPGIRPQTVGEHSAQMLRIYLSVWGAPSPEVTAIILLHDMGEIGVGDAQFQAKRRWPELKEAHDHAERVVVNDILTTDIVCESSWNYPTEAEAARIKICDLLEGFEFSCEELALGNRFAVTAARAFRQVLIDKGGSLPLEDQKPLWAYINRPSFEWLMNIYNEAIRA